MPDGQKYDGRNTTRPWDLPKSLQGRAPVSEVTRQANEQASIAHLLGLTAVSLVH